MKWKCNNSENQFKSTEPRLLYHKQLNLYSKWTMYKRCNYLAFGWFKFVLTAIPPQTVVLTSDSPTQSKSKIDKEIAMNSMKPISEYQWFWWQHLVEQYILSELNIMSGLNTHSLANDHEWSLSLDHQIHWLLSPLLLWKRFFYY